MADFWKKVGFMDFVRRGVLVDGAGTGVGVRVGVGSSVTSGLAGAGATTGVGMTCRVGIVKGGSIWENEPVAGAVGEQLE